MPVRQVVPPGRIILHRLMILPEKHGLSEAFDGGIFIPSKPESRFTRRSER
jgi:hypothetical protein